jgi:hypothetical protein
MSFPPSFFPQNPAAASGGVNCGAAWLSPVNLYGPLAANSSGNYTDGLEFRPMIAMSCLGIRFWGFAGQTYKVSLWNSSGTRLIVFPSVMASVTGVQTVMFPTPIPLTALSLYYVSFYNGTYESKCSNSYNYTLTPFYYNPFIQIINTTCYASGDGFPNGSSSSGCYPVEPICSSSPWVD